MRRVVLVALRFYQLAISPALGQHCRYYPSCSSYAAQAIGSQGVLRGTLLGLWRLLRCNPWSRGGFDPVPPRRLSTRGSAAQPALAKARSWIRS
jgi:putative membrane protein insertion efficiency factor